MKVTETTTWMISTFTVEIILADRQKKLLFQVKASLHQQNKCNATNIACFNLIFLIRHVEDVQLPCFV